MSEPAGPNGHGDAIIGSFVLPPTAKRINGHQGGDSPFGRQYLFDHEAPVTNSSEATSSNVPRSPGAEESPLPTIPMRHDVEPQSIAPLYPEASRPRSASLPEGSLPLPEPRESLAQNMPTMPLPLVPEPELTQLAGFVEEAHLKAGEPDEDQPAQHPEPQMVEKARFWEKLEKTWDAEQLEQLQLKNRTIQAEERLKLAELESKQAEERLKLAELEAKVHRKSRPEALELNIGAWLAGAGPADLRECSDSERRKVCAIGYTVLVPTIFALMAASYAVSTLTQNAFVITTVAIAWAFMILLVDRAIIASYSPFMRVWSKVSVVTLRLTVAVLMGLTVSHPLTLLLFKDTITTEIEAERAKEIEELRKTFADQKQTLDARMAIASTELDKQRKALDDSYEAKFIRPAESTNASAIVGSGLTAQEQLTLDQRVEEASKAMRLDFAELDNRIQTQEQAKSSLQLEIDDWQRQFEAEINGQRSGVAGIGPRARSIQKDQLEWRRADMQRMTDELRTLASRRVEIQNAIAASADGIRKEMDRAAMERAARIQSEQDRVAGLQRQAQSEQMTAFLENQNTVRAQIQAAIDTAQEDKQRLSDELAALAIEEKESLEKLRAAPRYDMLAQTLALHHLFEDPKAGGHFAMMAYFVLAGLFLAIDTMPILVKFTSKKGEYEIRRERALKDTKKDGVLAHLPANLRTLQPDEASELHQQVVEYYKHEQNRKTWLKEKEALMAKAEREAAEIEATTNVAIRNAGREAEANAARARAHLAKLELDTVRNDPHGILKHQLQENQVARNRERFVKQGIVPPTDATTTPASNGPVS